MRSDLKQFRVLAVPGPQHSQHFMIEVNNTLLNAPDGYSSSTRLTATMLLTTHTGLDPQHAATMVHIAQQCGQIVAFHPNDFTQVFPAE